MARALARLVETENRRMMREHGLSLKVTAIVDSRGSCSDDNGLDLRIALQAKEKYGSIGKYPAHGQMGSAAKQEIFEREADVIVETTPTNYENGEPGLSNIQNALSRGRHVVTTNKGPLALAMPALLELANHKKAKFRFSGTVGAGTPFLELGKTCLHGERILFIRGILNGTSNYILSRMEESGTGLEEALAEAKKKGYAEADLEYDLSGMDTAAKIVILSNWVMGIPLTLRQVRFSGISKIPSQKLRKARTSGAGVRLIGRLQDSRASVGLEELGPADPLFVSGMMNAVTYQTEHAGQLTLTGPGAGGEETASAIVRDLVEIRRTYSA